jgi:cyclopropane-fatty-acyl-phospholipid synthase
MDGVLRVENGSLAELLDLVIRNVAHHPPSAWSRFLRALRTAYRQLFERNDLFKSWRNVTHHYDIDHRIYRLFLDRDQQYSCAYFTRPDISLEEAQEAKREHIAHKLLLQPGHRVLDIGCGWGGLGFYLAGKHGASVLGITLSKEQLAIARSRAKEQDLAGRVAFELADYRNVEARNAPFEGEAAVQQAGSIEYRRRPVGTVSGTNTAAAADIGKIQSALETRQKFDRIVSVGMFEHVGKRFYEGFFAKCCELLTDDGVFLLHTIGRLDGPSDTNAWVWKYIFPGGYIPGLSELAPIIEKSGLILADIEVLRLHYAETLRVWRERFLASRHEVLKLFESDPALTARFGTAERFIRMWEFYLAAFEPTFRYYGLAVFQIQLTKKLDAVPLTRDYLYRERVGQSGLIAAE